MKKELLALGMLFLLLAAVFLNSSYLEKLTTELADRVSEAEEAAASGNWKEAEAVALSAIEHWDEQGKYTHVVLNHNEIGLMSDAFYEFLEEIHSEDAGMVESTGRMVRTRLSDIAAMEAPSPGSIF